MLLNKDYNCKYYVLSCPQYSNYICSILGNGTYIYISTIYGYVHQHVSQYPFVNLCQLVPKAWKDILIDNGHEAETTFSPFIQTHLIHLIRVSQKSIVINCDHFYFVPFNSRLVQEMQEIVSFHQLKNLKAESRSKANNCIINDNPRGFII